MKTTMIKGLLIAGLSLSCLLAKSNNTDEIIMQEVSKTIKESVNIPASMSKYNNKVEILFSTGQNGFVNFVLAKTEDQKLKKEIEKQFYKMNLNNLKQDAVNSVVLNFKTI